jgi:N utilization substance protein B
MSPRIGSRRLSRELALRALFQVDVASTAPEAAVEAVSDEERYSEDTLAFARELVLGASTHIGELDAAIQKHAHGWTLSRMANVDRNILRLAMYELLYLADIPASVTIDEAVELAKKYSTAESGRFVNGVLGNVVRRLEEERAEE